MESPIFSAGLFFRLEPVVLLRVSAVGQDRLWHGCGDGLPQGRGSELLGKGADCGPADVGSQDGRLSPVGGDSSAVLSGLRPVLFYELSAVYWLALHSDDVRGWFGDVRVLAANSRGWARCVVGWGGVYVCADLFGVSVGWALCQDGGHCAVPVDYLGVGKGSGAAAADLLGGGWSVDCHVYLLASADDVLRAVGLRRLFPI